MGYVVKLNEVKKGKFRTKNGKTFPGMKVTGSWITKDGDEQDFERTLFDFSSKAQQSMFEPFKSGDIVEIFEAPDEKGYNRITKVVPRSDAPAPQAPAPAAPARGNPGKYVPASAQFRDPDEIIRGELLVAGAAVLAAMAKNSEGFNIMKKGITPVVLAEMGIELVTPWYEFVKNGPGKAVASDDTQVDPESEDLDEPPFEE